jgi:periplasmic protein TonB
MSAHADVLERPEPLTKPFWVSLTLHIVMLVGLGAGAWVDRHRIRMGDPNGGGIGGMLVNPVASIPLPNRGGPENPVANDTQSQVPTPPAPKEKAKPIPKVKAPPPDAVPLKSDKALTKRMAEAKPQPQVNKYREVQTFDKSQLYSDVGQRASSPIYQMPGGGGVGLGNNSPFGDQFGYYANIIRDNIARAWKPLKSPGVVSVVVTFTIHRDGSVTNVKIATSSGNETLDISAQRAVMDANLPALPDRFPRNQADVEMKFELGN